MSNPVVRSPALIVLHSDILHPDEDGAPASGGSHAVTHPPPSDPPVRMIPLEGQEWVIGRDQGCQIRVRPQRIDVSRRHILIRAEQQQFLLHDQSSYGTFVNGQQVKGCWILAPGDVIGLATTHEMLRFVDSSVEQAPPVLTQRERAVLQLLGAGKLNKEIATLLQISATTVNSYLKSIYEKLNAHNRTEAVNTARRYRLL